MLPAVQAATICTRRIDLSAGDVLPLLTRQPNGFCLMGSEDSELDVEIGKDLEGCEINRSFRQPHTFGLAAETKFEVGNSPSNLDALIVRICEGHNGVVVTLSNRVAMAVVCFCAQSIGLNYLLVNILTMPLKP